MTPRIITIIFVCCLSLLSVDVCSQTAPQSTPAAGYTPPPVSTTYRPLTGKLFFTDAERDRLDKARKDGVLIVDGEVVARSPQVEGFVKSSSGRTTYWVDGGQRLDARSSNNIAAKPSMTGAESRIKFLESGVPAPAQAPVKSAPQKRKKPPPNKVAEQTP